MVRYGGSILTHGIAVGQHGPLLRFHVRVGVGRRENRCVVERIDNLVRKGVQKRVRACKSAFTDAALGLLAHLMRTMANLDFRPSLPAKNDQIARLEA